MCKEQTDTLTYLLKDIFGIEPVTTTPILKVEESKSIERYSKEYWKALLPMIENWVNDPGAILGSSGRVLDYPQFDGHLENYSVEHPPKFKSCPMCGDDDIFSCCDEGPAYYIQCCCGVEGPTCDTEEQATEAWNKRV